MITTKFQKRLAAVWLLLSALLFVILAPPAWAAEADGREAYYAELGDTVEKISFLYGLDEKLVAAMNNLSITARLREQQLIWLPLEPVINPPEPPTVTVTAGDTLWSIARANGTSIVTLCELNGIEQPDYLQPGQTLALPQQETDGLTALGESKMVLARVETASRASSLIWPVAGSISSSYGWRSRGWHCGLDIAANLGSTVTASAPGIVTQAGWRSAAYGYSVMLDHGNELSTLYAHNSQVLVEEGQFVRQGQPIALVGESGNATGPHVHLEVRINNICQNPIEYLR